MGGGMGKNLHRCQYDLGDCFFVDAARKETLSNICTNQNHFARRMKIVLEILLIVFAFVNLLLAYRASFRLHQPTTLISWIIKVMASGLSPILFLVGIEIALFGLLLNSIPATTIGGLSALIFLIH